MPEIYEHVAARSAQEAIDKSKYALGQLGKIVRLRANSNYSHHEGTWTVTPEFELLPTERDPYAKAEERGQACIN